MGDWFELVKTTAFALLLVFAFAVLIIAVIA